MEIIISLNKAKRVERCLEELVKSCREESKNSDLFFVRAHRQAQELGKFKLKFNLDCDLTCSLIDPTLRKITQM